LHLAVDNHGNTPLESITVVSILLTMIYRKKMNIYPDEALEMQIRLEAAKERKSMSALIMDAVKFYFAHKEQVEETAPVETGNLDRDSFI